MIYSRRALYVSLVFILTASPMIVAQSLEPRVRAGVCLSKDRTLLVRPDAKPWEFANANDPLFSRDLLLALPGTRAILAPRPDSVEVTLWGNLPELSVFAGLESAVVLHDSRSLDLDVSLVRGRIILTNRKKEGSAKIWIRLPALFDHGSNLPAPAFGLELAKPGDSVAVEVAGRWPAGVPFRRVPLAHETPTRGMSLTVLKGQVSLKSAGVTHTLSAPPGPASFEWNTVVGPANGPQRFERVPAWVAPDPAGQAQQTEWAKLALTFATESKGKAPKQALADWLDTTKEITSIPLQQAMGRFGILGQAAIGDLPLVVAALENSNQLSVRSSSILGLRNFIGEMPGRDQQLFSVLRQNLGYSAAEAGTILQMLHSPFVARQAETYQTLLAYLRHSRVSIRELAHWHLVRLLPMGAKIAFDATAPEEKRAEAWKAWRILVDK